MSDDSAMNNVFGKRPRPNHPDFWKLSQIVLKLDGRMDEAAPADREAIFKATVEENVDLESLSYMATQRTIRAGIPLTPQNAMLLMKIASAWLDGFNVGAAYVKEP